MDVLSPLNGVTASAQVESVTLDFGSEPTWSKTFTVALAGASAGQKIVMSAAATADGELEMDGFACAARVTATDQIEASIQAVPGPVTGTRVFNIVRG